jgi:hypothetical protein
LAITVFATAAPVGAATNLDVSLYDGLTCSGTSFGVTHEYNDLGSVGWNDRTGAIKAYTTSLSGHLHRDVGYAGETFAFASNSSDCNLSDNFMAIWLGTNLYWNDQASSISHN